MRFDKDAISCRGANISQRDITIFLLYVDLIISALCVFLVVTTYFCNSSDEDFVKTNWILYVFFLWHASKLVVVSVGLVGSLKNVPWYLIPYICYWGLLTAFLLFYSLFLMVLSITKIKNTEDYAEQPETNGASTSYPPPTNKTLEPTNIAQLVLEYSLNNVALIVVIFIVMAVLSGYLTTVVHGFYKSLKRGIPRPGRQVADAPEITGHPTTEA